MALAADAFRIVLTWNIHLVLWYILYSNSKKRAFAGWMRPEKIYDHICGRARPFTNSSFVRTQIQMQNMQIRKLRSLQFHQVLWMINYNNIRQASAIKSSVNLNETTVIIMQRTSPRSFCMSKGIFRRKLFSSAFCFHVMNRSLGSLSLSVSLSLSLFRLWYKVDRRPHYTLFHSKIITGDQDTKATSANINAE
jgi:hypothetical protein